MKTTVLRSVSTSQIRISTDLHTVPGVGLGIGSCVWDRVRGRFRVRFEGKVNVEAYVDRNPATLWDGKRKELI